MFLLNIYKLQYLDVKTGFWVDISRYSADGYIKAVTSLYDEYKLNNTRQIRLVHEKEELVDCLFPPGS